MEAFINFIMNIIKYITELVGYFRAKNDGDNSATQPNFGA